LPISGAGDFANVLATGDAFIGRTKFLETHVLDNVDDDCGAVSRNIHTGGFYALCCMDNRRRQRRCLTGSICNPTRRYKEGSAEKFGHADVESRSSIYGRSVTDSSRE
jgi:hypothetical protein